MKLLILSLLLFSCTNQRKVMDSWLGLSKHDLIMSWGPPAREASDGSDGEILIYSSAGADGYGTTYYMKMFYVNKENNIYHWVTRTSSVPPMQVDLNVYRQ